MFTIEPLLCEVLYLPPPVAAYMNCGDRDIPVPVFAFLITADAPDDDTAVLVDTGMKSPDEEGLVHGRNVGIGRGFEPLREGLAERGLEPTDVDYVVLTHLHHDHAAHTGKFTEAEVVVQRAELESAEAPLPPFERSYDDAHRAVLEEMETTVVDGDHTLLDGIELLFTPGHTPGLQSLLVETKDGPVAVASDIAYSTYNLDPSMDSYLDAEGNPVEVDPHEGDYWPPGIFVDLAECFESVERIREHVDDDERILLCHDASLME